MATTIPLHAVIADPKLNFRQHIDQSVVKDYAENLDNLPNVTVFRIDGDYYLTDGFHRYEAHKLAGRTEITAHVKRGTLKDAEVDAAQANTRHGKPLSTEEKHAAIRALLSQRIGQRRIAEIMSLSPGAVWQVANADKTQRNIGDDIKLSMAHLREVSRVPKERQRQFAEAVRDNLWSRDEARAAADAVVEPEKFPKDHAEKLLTGDADPIQESNGSYKMPVESIGRRVRKAQESDVKTPVWGFLEAGAIARERVEQNGYPEFDAEESNRVEAELERIEGFTAELRAALKEQRSRLSLVSNSR